MRELLEFVLVGHWRSALAAAVLFAGGLGLSLLLPRRAAGAVAWLPAQVLRFVLWLMGPAPGLARTAVVIWWFNSTAVFAYMAGGFHPVLPWAFAFWTGLNVGLLATGAQGGAGARWRLRRPPGAWVPPRALAAACGVAVLLLELPCFWYAIALGVGMGVEVQAGADYPEALSRAGAAYAQLIVPVLLVSAAAESVVVRGGASAAVRPSAAIRHGTGGAE